MKNYTSIFLVFISCSLTSVAQRIDTIRVKVHDHVMTLYSSGVGSPVVILEAGGASNHKTWDNVQHKIARFTKVVSYDRAGYLNSEPCTKQRDAETVAKESKEALTKAGVNPPYILTGWSLGGAFVRVFAGLYPKDVVGLVLVDPAPEESYARFEKEHPEVWKEAENYVTQVMSSNRVGEREEMRYYDSSMNQARRSDAKHATRTILLIAPGKAPGGQDRDPSDPLNKIWIEELEKWGKKRPNTKYEIITNSGHHIARDQPDTVVHAIRQLVQQYQTEKLKQENSPYKKPLQLNDGIQIATLQEVGIDEKIIKKMQDSITAGNYPNIHSVLILKNNKLVYEKYFSGNDVVRGKGFVGFVDHYRDSLHDIRSVTKSVTGAAVLIAHEQGKIKSLNQSVFDFFPEYAKYDTGLKKQITVQHLLNMSAGLEWNEDIPYTDPRNSEIRMDNAPVAIEFVLSQPLVDTPGRKYNYSGGCSQVLAAIIEKATGMQVDKFTEQFLFKPLGIDKYTWVNNSDGKPSAASGLRMRSRDMAKFGLLFFNNGKWNNRQLIPHQLVEQTLTSQISTPFADSIVPFVGYSNQFWIIKEKIRGKLVDYVQAQGNGGQIIQLDKANNLLLIITAGNYNRRGLRKSSFDIYPDFVYPAVTKKVINTYKKPLQLKDGIQTATLKDVAIDEKIIRAMTDSITNGNYTNVHSVLISRNNKLVYEQYFPGYDYVRGKGDAGFRNQHRDTLHDIRSITKSITSAAVMIAHAQGKFKSLDQRVFDFFPELSKYSTGMKRQITIQHLLNMSSGLYWRGEVESFMDSMKLTNAPAAIEFVLKQRLVDTPGTKFNYSDGSTQVLAAILERATGMDIEKFATRYLFHPLGITNFEWTKQKSGMISAWAGLRMRSRDLLKFGMLYLNDGKWNGKQIIPADLIAQSLGTQIATSYSDSSLYVGYSNQFWIFSESIKDTPITYAEASGNGGQKIVIDRQNQLVLVTTAGNYYQTNIRKTSWHLYYDFVFPAVVSKSTNAEVVEVLKELTYKAIRAEFDFDTATVASLMDENFISVYPHKTQNKKQELDGMYRSITKMKEAGRVVDSIYLDEFKVQLVENTAITSYYTVVKSRMKGESIPDSRWRWLDVWAEKNGQWKWVASQATPLTK